MTAPTARLLRTRQSPQETPRRSVGLLLAYACDLEQVLARCGTLAAQTAQRGVRADDVRRDVVLIRQLATQGPEPVEQLGVITHARARIQRSSSRTKSTARRARLAETLWEARFFTVKEKPLTRCGSSASPAWEPRPTTGNRPCDCAK